LALVVGPANRNDHRLLAETLDSLVARRPARTARATDVQTNP
jgi:hypothetical protein